MTFDGVTEFEDEPTANAGETPAVSPAQDDPQQDDTASLNEVPRPGDDEVITLTGLAGQTIHLGFNPGTAEFFQVNGDLIAALPDGGVVVLEGFTAALNSDTPPILLFNGRPLAIEKILAAHDGELQIVLAGEIQAPAQGLVAGGTSAYDEDLDPELGEIETIAVGFENGRKALKTWQVSGSSDVDELFDLESGSSTLNDSSIPTTSFSTLPSGKGNTCR